MPWANALLPLALWADLFVVLGQEWELNEQYAYGWLVPFGWIYLVWLRWSDRPSPGAAPGGRSRIAGSGAIDWLLAAIVGALVPLRVILEANPDWRRLYWLQAGICLGATFLCLLRWGGARWCRHFAWVAVFPLVSIPWPTFIERWLVWGSMGPLAAVTGWLLNAWGVYARVEGHVIEMARGTVGLEDACSGIRSIQVTLMAALFVGELFRFRRGARVALTLASLAMAYGLNLARVLVLAWGMARGGAETLNALHDPVGYALSGATLACAGLLALLFSRRRGARAIDPPVAGARQADLLSGRAVALALALFCAGYAVTGLWYGAGPSRGVGSRMMAPDWNRLGAQLRDVEIPPRTRAQLRYTAGRRVEWKGAEGVWSAVYLEWDRGRASGFLGVHRPEICLPSTGFTQVDESWMEKWERGDRKMELVAQLFARGDRLYHVWHAVWDEIGGGEAFGVSRSGTDRVGRALARVRADRRRSFELVLQGEITRETSWELAREVLDKLFGEDG